MWNLVWRKIINIIGAFGNPIRLCLFSKFQSGDSVNIRGYIFLHSLLDFQLSFFLSHIVTRGIKSRSRTKKQFNAFYSSAVLNIIAEQELEKIISTIYYITTLVRCVRRLSWNSQQIPIFSSINSLQALHVAYIYLYGMHPVVCCTNSVTTIISTK
jgi:hypothetical protein